MEVSRGGGKYFAEVFCIQKNVRGLAKNFAGYC